MRQLEALQRYCRAHGLRIDSLRNLEEQGGAFSFRHTFLEKLDKYNPPE